MNRRNFIQALFAIPPVSSTAYAQRVAGLPALRITDVKVIATSAGHGYQWLFLKVSTSEPGLYGIGSASNLTQASAVATAIVKNYAGFWIGKDPDPIEDLWQSTNVRPYWRNSTIQNNVLSALDMALWDLKGKRANMPVYDLLGGKCRDAVPLYAHADGDNMKEVAESVRKLMGEGYRHVRAQMGGYGGGGMIPAGKGSRPKSGFRGIAFDEEQYVGAIPKLFEHLRVELGTDVKLLHDVHEHLTPIRAVELAKRLEPYSLFYLEDALPPEQIQWFRQIRNATTTPLAMGELFTHPGEYVPLVAERLVDFVRNRISQTGGITQAKKVAAICEAFGVRTAWQDGGDCDPINQLANYHLDLTIPSFGIQEENHFPPLVHEMMPGCAELKGGYLYASGAPGLGIDIREELAAKYPLEPLPLGDDWTTVRGLDGSLVRP